MIKYSVKGALGDTSALHIGMLPGHKRPSIWIEKYGENYIIGSLRSDRAAHDLEVMIDAMLHPEKEIQQADGPPADSVVCPTCRGHGIVPAYSFLQMSHEAADCPRCRGNGWIVE